VTTKATLYGAGNADLGLCAIGQRLLIRNDLEGGDHIPVAALRIVSELSDRVPRRQVLDTPCRLAKLGISDGKTHRRGLPMAGKEENGAVAGLDHGSRDLRVGPARNASGYTLLPS
jgi:hypothetical protein